MVDVGPVGSVAAGVVAFLLGQGPLVEGHVGLVVEVEVGLLHGASTRLCLLGLGVPLDSLHPLDAVGSRCFAPGFHSLGVRLRLTLSRFGPNGLGLARLGLTRLGPALFLCLPRRFPLCWLRCWPRAACPGGAAYGVVVAVAVLE